MSELQRGTLVLVLELPPYAWGSRAGQTSSPRFQRHVIVHDYGKKPNIKVRIEKLLMELRRNPAFRRPDQYNGWKGRWETTQEDWQLFLTHWTQDIDPAVVRGMLYMYPVCVIG